MNMNTGWQGAQASGEDSMARPGFGGKNEAGTAKKPSENMALGGELVSLLKEGVDSGDADRGLPEEIARMVEAGAGARELMEALRQATEKGRISPLLLAKAEKLLGMGPGADELTDRSQVVRGNRNKLLW